ncbi:hypothetical protein ACOSQ3_032586 [Xanthoceras sorbifolium]
MSWLVNSMEPNIGENFLLYETAAEVWEAAKDTYSYKDNTPELYYNKFHQSWQQLDAFEKYSWDTTSDLKLYKKIIENKPVYKFCLSLNLSLDAVRGRIFNTKPLPSLREAFSEVQKEESRRHLMLGTEKSAGGSESSALAVRNQQQPRKGERPWCEHCRRPGNHVSNNNETSPITADSNPFSKEQMDVLQRIFNHQSQNSMNSVIGTGSLAQKGLGFGEDDWQC